jgi:hypothetical protein
MDKKKIIAISIILTLGIFSEGCLTQTDNAAPLIKETGVIEFYPLPGGFYHIVSDRGTMYNPVNRENQSLPNGTHVYFEAVRISNTSMDRSKGIPIEIKLITEYVPPDHTVNINLTKNE